MENVNGLAGSDDRGRLIVLPPIVLCSHKGDNSACGCTLERLQRSADVGNGSLCQTLQRFGSILLVLSSNQPRCNGAIFASGHKMKVPFAVCWVSMASFTVVTAEIACFAGRALYAHGRSWLPFLINRS